MTDLERHEPAQAHGSQRERLRRWPPKHRGEPSGAVPSARQIHLV